MKKEVKSYHSKTTAQTLKELSSNLNGISIKEAKKRIAIHGQNVLPERKKLNPLFLFLKQFHNLFFYILIFAATISYFFENLIDAYVIFLVIIINGIIGFFQEYRAEKAITALKKMIVHNSKVYRSGQLIKLSSSRLVPGDIISLEEGDRIPADCRLIEVNNFRTIESSLTGESLPSDKNLSKLPLKTSLAERRNMVWMGTYVASGSAKAIIIATGAKTEIGTLALEIGKIKIGKSHFRKKTDTLALYMGILAALGAILTFIVGFYFREIPFSEIFLFSIASLVSGIPEGLPAVLVIVLAIGAFRMARRKALIRTLTATETLGVVTTILTDKTGTLTQNTMTVEKLVLPGEKEISVTGKGWGNEGCFIQDQKEISLLNKSHLNKFIQIAAVCNKSSVIKKEEKEKVYDVIGDPTEASLTVLAEKAGFKKMLTKGTLLDDAPFDQELKYRASLISSNQKKGKKEIYLIGAPETLLALSTHMLKKHKKIKIQKSEREELLAKINTLSTRSLRVLALAYREVPAKTEVLSEPLLNNLVLSGFVGMKDPPRPEVKLSIEKARNAGIDVIMATGDHKNTAIAIAKEIGLLNQENAIYPQAMTEEELLQLEKKSKKKFEKMINHVKVFARLTPKMKLRITEILQKSGKIVAMTGDGVNDAPALKKADIGISMGIMGTDVARESSDMVLADDNFASIVDAVEEGRIVFKNTRQTSTFLATTSFAEGATILTTLLFGMPLPLLPTQILWLNLVTDVGPALGLAAEQGHGEVLNNSPRNPKENILTKSIMPNLILMTLIMVILTLLVFDYFLPHGLEKARTGAFAVMIFTQLFNTFNMRSLKKSIFKIKFWSNTTINIALFISVALSLFVLFIPSLQKIFHLGSLTLTELTIIVLLSSLVLIGGEIHKKIRNA